MSSKRATGRTCPPQAPPGSFQRRYGEWSGVQCNLTRGVEYELPKGGGVTGGLAAATLEMTDDLLLAVVLQRPRGCLAPAGKSLLNSISTAIDTFFFPTSYLAINGGWCANSACSASEGLNPRNTDPSGVGSR